MSAKFIACFILISGLSSVLISEDAGLFALSDPQGKLNEDEKTKLGDEQIRKAIELLQAGQHQIATELLHQGVENSPSNLIGRESLAGFYVHILSRYDRAVEVLWDGFQYGGAKDFEYLKVAIDAAVRGRMSDRLLWLHKNYLEEAISADDEARAKLLIYSGAYAYYLKGQYLQSEELLEERDVVGIFEGALLQAEIRWARGDQEDSLKKIEELYEMFPYAPDLLSKLCEYHREAENYDDSRRYGALLVMQQPSNHSFRIQLMHTYRESGDRTALSREIDRMFSAFNENEIAMRNLAFFASADANIDLMHRVYEKALTGGFNMGHFTYLLIETYVRAGEFEGALANLEVLSQESPDWFAEKPHTVAGVEAIALYATNDPEEARDRLDYFLKGSGTTARNLLQIYTMLAGLDLFEEAKMVLEEASERFPVQTRFYISNSR